MSNKDYYGGGDFQHQGQPSPQGYNQYQHPNHGHNQYQQSPQDYSQVPNYPPQGQQHPQFSPNHQSPNYSHQISPNSGNNLEPRFAHPAHYGLESHSHISSPPQSASYSHEVYQIPSSHDPYGHHHTANPGGQNDRHYGGNNSGINETGVGYAGPGQQDGDRGIGATIVGGAAGGLMAHKSGGGLMTSVLGSVVGAVGANILENKLEKHKKHKKEKKHKKHGSKSRDIHGDHSSSSGSDSD